MEGEILLLVNNVGSFVGAKEVLGTFVGENDSAFEGKWLGNGLGDGAFDEARTDRSSRKAFESTKFT